MLRVGLGYDSHRFGAARPLILGGIRIEHDRGLEGHSDADAVLHAITDAILGAIGQRDIGEQFPDADPEYAGADSSLFVRQAVAMAAQKGGGVGNCDVTVIAERPRLGPYKQAMRERIAALLDLGAPAVSVKAKTNEGMGAIGRGEGIVAMAVVLMIQIKG